jgi:uncharacterized protein YdhG (YjbR/CyaY superfamily)
MEPEIPSAQGSEVVGAPAVGEGIQARINELVAKQRQAEEALRERDRQLMEQSSQMAQMAMQAQRPVLAPVAPVDPLAQFQDRLDPVAAQAIQAAVEATRKQMEAQYAPMFAQQAAQIAGFAVQQEAATIPGLPREVTNRAAQLAAQWRNANLQFPPGDALNFALGEYQRGQLLRAAPVSGYNPNAFAAPPIVPGYAPPPPAPRTSALPANYDQLTRVQQMAALEASGVGDETF